MEVLKMNTAELREILYQAAKGDKEVQEEVENNSFSNDDDLEEIASKIVNSSKTGEIIEGFLKHFDVSSEAVENMKTLAKSTRDYQLVSCILQYYSQPKYVKDIVEVVGNKETFEYIQTFQQYGKIRSVGAIGWAACKIRDLKTTQKISEFLMSFYGTDEMEGIATAIKIVTIRTTEALPEVLETMGAYRGTKMIGRIADIIKDVAFFALGHPEVVKEISETFKEYRNYSENIIDEVANTIQDPNVMGSFEMNESIVNISKLLRDKTVMNTMEKLKNTEYTNYLGDAIREAAIFSAESLKTVKKVSEVFMNFYGTDEIKHVANAIRITTSETTEALLEVAETLDTYRGSEMIENVCKAIIEINEYGADNTVKEASKVLRAYKGRKELVDIIDYLMNARSSSKEEIRKILNEYMRKLKDVDTLDS